MRIEKFFPGFVSKAITFSIDDGNLKYDKVFIDIVRPAGIKGTFNLYFGSSERSLGNEAYRNFYKGFEIANHCNRHPFAFDCDKKYEFAKEPFDSEKADKALVYKADGEGIYRIYHRSYWATVATLSAYLRLAEEGREDIEEIFGKGSVKGFVWPYGKQNDSELFERLKASGYKWIRRVSGHGFSVPEDKMDWGVNADSASFEEKIREFESLSDDGVLKFFCLGLHSVDFERANKWEALKDFALKYGNRPNDFYYATVSEIFEYEEAVRLVYISDGKVYNPSDKKVFIKINNKEYIIEPTSEKEI